LGCKTNTYWREHVNKEDWPEDRALKKKKIKVMVKWVLVLPLLLFIYLETGSLYVVQTDLEFLGSGDPSASGSRVWALHMSVVPGDSPASECMDLASFLVQVAVGQSLLQMGFRWWRHKIKWHYERGILFRVWLAGLEF
jgi:hypothetical protein